MRACLVATAFIAVLFALDAKAQSCPLNGDCDQGQAYALCMASGAASKAANPDFSNFRCDNHTGTNEQSYYQCGLESRYFPGSYGYSCNQPRTLYYKDSCSKRSEEFGWQGGDTAASVNACHMGCMYTSSLDPQGTAGVSFTPTGGACTESDAPAPTPAGDGGDPGGGDGGGTDPGGGDGGGDNGGGDGGGGTDPGGGDGGGGTGPGDGDGGGDDGGGDGGGTGPGPGPGPGDGDGDGPGQPGSDGDALYESEGKTVEKLYDDFAERVSKAPIIDATKSFFEISVSASCPIFTFPATAYWDAMTFDFLCKPEIVAILQLLGWLLLAFAAFHAIKIALT